MALYYFDASALVKYYVTEPGSTWVREIIDERDLEGERSLHLILVAEIARVGRIRRTERDRAYHRFISQLTHRYAITPLIPGDVAAAAHLTQRHPLKAYDAVQLAVALRYRQALTDHQLLFTFISGDATLNAAAQAEELAIDNPFDHVSPTDVLGRSV